MPTHHAGQRALHAGHHDDRVGIGQQMQIGGEPMRPRHAHVLHEVDLRPGPEGRLAGLFRHGQVARAGGDDRHAADRHAVVAGRLRHAKRAADRIVVGRRKLRQQLGSLLGRHPRGQHIRALLKLGFDDLGNRLDRLALREDDFGKTAAAAAVRVDLGHADIGNARALDLAREFGCREFSGQ